MITAPARKRRPTLPESLICSTVEAIDLLSRKVFDDAIKAKWLAPCCSRDTGSVIYSTQAVQDVARRILAGEYPIKK